MNKDTPLEKRNLSLNSASKTLKQQTALSEIKQMLNSYNISKNYIFIIKRFNSSATEMNIYEVLYKSVYNNNFVNLIVDKKNSAISDKRLMYNIVQLIKDNNLNIEDILKEEIKPSKLENLKSNNPFADIITADDIDGTLVNRALNNKNLISFEHHYEMQDNYIVTETIPITTTLVIKKNKLLQKMLQDHNYFDNISIKSRDSACPEKPDDHSLLIKNYILYRIKYSFFLLDQVEELQGNVEQQKKSIETTFTTLKNNGIVYKSDLKILKDFAKKIIPNIKHYDTQHKIYSYNIIFTAAKYFKDDMRECLLGGDNYDENLEFILDYDTYESTKLTFLESLTEEYSKEQKIELLKRIKTIAEKKGLPDSNENNQGTYTSCINRLKSTISPIEQNQIQLDTSNNENTSDEINQEINNKTDKDPSATINYIDNYQEETLPKELYSSTLIAKNKIDSKKDLLIQKLTNLQNKDSSIIIQTLKNDDIIEEVADINDNSLSVLLIEIIHNTLENNTNLSAEQTSFFSCNMVNFSILLKSKHTKADTIHKIALIVIQNINSFNHENTKNFMDYIKEVDLKLDITEDDCINNNYLPIIKILIIKTKDHFTGEYAKQLISIIDEIKAILPKESGMHRKIHLYLAEHYYLMVKKMDKDKQRLEIKNLYHNHEVSNKFKSYIYFICQKNKPNSIPPSLYYLNSKSLHKLKKDIEHITHNYLNTKINNTRADSPNFPYLPLYIN